MSRIGTYLQKRGNTREESVKMDPSEIEQMVMDLLPNFSFKITTSSVPFKIERIFPATENIASVGKLSSGESEVLTLAVDLLTICAMWELENATDKILVIDEPDTHLHPELQQHLAKFFIRLTERFNCQMVIATHSTTLLSALGFYGKDKTSVIYLNNSQEEQKAKKFDETLKILSSCLGGHVLMGPLFGFPLLLVEGDDDYVIWSEAVRQHKLKLAIIPCNGSEIKTYKKTLETLLGSILENTQSPSAYCLKDRDQTGAITHDQSTSAVPILKLECHESENLYLSDEVLQTMNKTWEQVKTAIQQRIAANPAEQTEWDVLLNGERKTSDIKSLIKKLAEIIDEKKLDWRVRIGKAIGSGKPASQLADFLGTAILNAFWPEEILPTPQLKTDLIQTQIV